MNPWDWAITVLGWTAFAVILLVSVFLVVLILRSMWQQIAKAFGKQPPAGVDPSEYLAEAQRLSTDYANGEVIMQSELRTAFMEGARWGWGFLHRR